MAKNSRMDKAKEHVRKLPSEPLGISSNYFKNNNIMFRLQGTVILRIWWQVLLVVIYTAGVVSLHLYVDGLRMDYPMSLIPVLGVVTGLLLVFRTNTAYDR